MLGDIGVDETRPINFAWSLSNFEGIVKAHAYDAVLLNTYRLRDIWHKSLVVGTGEIV